MVTSFAQAYGALPADLEEPIVASPAMVALFATIERLARASVPVLIQGETGSGKEVCARALHDASARSAGPFVCVSCGSVPSSMLESTLFGHEKGALAGGGVAHAGVLESANGGTVFLDGASELPLAIQASFLRVLKAGRLVPVGGDCEIKVDVQLVFGVSRDLERLVSEGLWEKELYQKLSQASVRIPPLRERVSEVFELAHLFLGRARKRRPEVESITSRAMGLLEAYDWPGNVRELKNVIERAAVVARGSLVDIEDLPDRVRDARRSIPLFESPRVPPALEPIPDYKEAMRFYETKLITNALVRTRWNQTKAAKLMNMPLRTLVHKIKTLGIQKPSREKR